jgi:hypothetical protein
MKLLKAIYSILEAVGQARAATHFARQGNFEAARATMETK